MSDIERDNTFHLSGSQLILKLGFLVFGFLLSFSIEGQTPVDTSKNDKILVENADNSITEIVDDVRIQYLRNNVRILHDSIFMFCDSARIKEQEMVAVGEVIVIQDDTIHIFSDSLFYNSEIKLAKLYYGVVLENGAKQLFTEALIYNVDDKFATFYDTTTLIHNTMQLSSLRGNYNVKEKRARFYDEVTIIDEDLKLKTDSLLYDTDVDRAYFLGPTFILQGEDKIYCEEGYYDIVHKKAYFGSSPIITNNDQKATGDNIRYDGIDSTFIITGNAMVVDSVSIAKGQVITKNSKEGWIRIEGDGYYENDDRIIKGPNIFYNERNENLILNGRSVIEGEKGNIEADSITYNKLTDFGSAVGNAVWKDTVQKIVVKADVFDYKEEQSYYKAIADQKRPLFSQVIDGDTLFLSADTLVSENQGDTLSYMIAMKFVKIFKSDIQAVCDSLYYDDIDSTFVLFEDPICWSDTTQFLGDTLSIQLVDDNVSDIISYSNAFISSEDIHGFYNQIKGRFIHSHLDSNVLKTMLINGNAESIYFIKDEEDKYIGPNYTACSKMKFYFDNDELVDVKYYTEPSSNMTPMDKAGKDKLFLDGFEWYVKNRPKDSRSITERVFSITNKSENDTKVPDLFQQTVNDAIFKSESKKPKSPDKKKRKK
ncbi:MAG: hypothetical protein HKO66_06040 [Saprospiraceae bacterium]|nr:hypothetical protein [Bacteroidia bacterium]NNL91771.1 hypothetical protein [Saprospiraceae bacterium]